MIEALIVRARRDRAHAGGARGRKGDARGVNWS